VPIADDDYVFFGRTTPDGVETVEAMVEEIPFYETVTFRDDGDETVFELRVSEPPLLSSSPRWAAPFPRPSSRTATIA